MMAGIPIEERLVLCRFGDNCPAVGQYETPDGCVCYPNDRTQVSAHSTS